MVNLGDFGTIRPSPPFRGGFSHLLHLVRLVRVSTQIPGLGGAPTRGAATDGAGTGAGAVGAVGEVGGEGVGARCLLRSERALEIDLCALQSVFA